MKGPKELVVAGLGLMGTSLIKALKETGPVRAVGLDRDRRPIQRAQQDHVIEEGALLGGEVENKVRRLLRASRFIVLALYPDGILPFIQLYRDAFQPGTLVMDICGLKGAFVEKAQALMPEGVEYVGTHPMAGTEKSGYEYGDGELFLGANFIITPTRHNRPESLQMVRDLATAMGCGRIREISPTEHDRMIAYTSQLPHVLAAALIRSWNGTEDIVSYAGGSFRDATRVAEINTGLWTQLFCFNQTELLAELTRYQNQLETFRALLETKDENAMEAFLAQASQRKINWRKTQEGDRYDSGRSDHTSDKSRR